MDSKLGVQRRHHHNHNGISKPPVHHHHHNGGKRGGAAGRQGGGGKGIKVVYISSPMMLTASAEEFRAVVQELTGRDSNVADHDLAAGAHYYDAGAPPSSSTTSSSSSYSSLGRVSPTGAAGGVAAGGARALSPTTMSTGANVVGTGGAAAGYGSVMMDAPPPFQSMYDQTAGSLLYGQDYW